MSYPRNNASPERIAVGAVVQISDGAVQTSGVSISVRGQGGASGAGSGTTAYDNGIVQYTPTQGETDFTSFVVVAYKTGCIPASVTVVTSAASVPGKVDVGAISGDSTAADNAESFFDGTGYAGTNNVIPTVTNVTNTPAFNGPSAATIADAVWDETLVGHQTIGTMGYYAGETHATGDLSYLIVSDGTNGNAAIKTYLTTNVGLLGVNLTAADDAVIAAIGALNNLSQANVRTAVGLATANLDTQLADLPTVAEFEARTLVAASYGTAANQSTIAGYLDTEVAAILAAVDTEVAAIKAKTDQFVFTVANQVDANALSGGGGLDAAGVRAAVGLATANLDTQLADIPTVSEFNARTLAAAAYFDPSTDIVTTTDTANITAILADTNELQSDWANGGRLDLILDARASQTSVDDVPTNAELATALGTADDAVLAAIAALNNLSAAQVNTECDTALSDAGVTTARMAALTDWIDGGRLDLLLDAILDDTGTAGVALSAAICNKVADHVRRRTQANVEASSDGDTLSLLSLYGAIQQIQQSAAVGSTLTVKKTDTTTTLGTRTLATDAGSDPVTGVS